MSDRADMRLALAVAALFRDLPGKPRGTLLWESQSAYFASVAEASADG